MRPIAYVKLVLENKMEQALSELHDSISHFERKYEDVQNVKRDVAMYLKEAADFIDENNRVKGRVTVGTSVVSGVGGGLSVAGGALLLTAATGGLALPFLIGGAAVGATAGVGSLISNQVKGSKEKGKIEMSDVAIQIYNSKIEERKNAFIEMNKKEINFIKTLEDVKNPEEKNSYKNRQRSSKYEDEFLKENGLHKTKNEDNPIDLIHNLVTSDHAGLGRKTILGAAAGIDLYAKGAQGAKIAEQLTKGIKNTGATAATAKAAKASGDAGYGAAKIAKIGARSGLDEAAKEGATFLGKSTGKWAAGLTIGLSGVCLLVDIGVIAYTVNQLYKDDPTKAAKKLRDTADKLFPDVKIPDTERKHNLSIQSYKTVTYCHKCKGMLFGLYNQGMQCSGCGFNYHKKCQSSLKNDCSGINGLCS